MTVSLRELLADPDVPDVMISGLSEDSRAVQSGDAFIAIQGELSDGHDFVEQAQTCGAVAILCERAVDTARIPAIVVADLKARRGALAARMYAEPSRHRPSITCENRSNKRLSRSRSLTSPCTSSTNSSTLSG